MKNNLDHLRKYERQHPFFKCKGEGLCGFFIIKSPCDNNCFLAIQSSDGEGWDHISVSTNRKRCPNWDEMSYVKDLFFKDNETVVQFHPKKSEYVNNANNCLHLWRNQNKEIELPPSILTGIK